jgi:hypothetical protein
MRTILMAYRGSEQDKRILRWLCRFAKHTRSNLRLVYVLAVGYTHEVDDPDAPGAKEAEQMLLESGTPRAGGGRRGRRRLGAGA